MRAAGIASARRCSTVPAVMAPSMPSAAVAPLLLLRVRMRPRGEQGEDRDRDEVAEGRVGPVHLRGAVVEPGRIDEEDDRGDHDLGEPADDEEERREHDPPEAELGQAERVPEVEHVPGGPEDERPEQDRRRERGQRDREPARHERPDPEDAQHDAEDRVHRSSLRGRPGLIERPGRLRSHRDARPRPGAAALRATGGGAAMESSSQTTGEPSYPVRLSVEYPDRELNRLTTAFRVIVAIPILIVAATLGD